MRVELAIRMVVYGLTAFNLSALVLTGKVFVRTFQPLYLVAALRRISSLGKGLLSIVVIAISKKGYVSKGNKLLKAEEDQKSPQEIRDILHRVPSQLNVSLPS